MARKLNTNPIYYVYTLFDWQGVPRYVGYGSRNRLDQHERESSINWLKDEFIEQTWTMLGEIPKVKIRENLTRAEACVLEIALIAAIGRIDLGTGPLTNMTAGGDGGDFGEAISRAKADWTDEERKRHGQTYKKATEKTWANLSQEDRKNWIDKLVKGSIAARQRLRETDPNYELNRSKSISEGHARRTLEQKQDAAKKALITNPPERRSELATAWHLSRTPEERSSTIQKGWNKLTPAERRQRVIGNTTAEQRSEQHRQQQANLTLEQQLKRAKRASNLGSNTRWINNGIQRIRLKNDQPLPSGWKYGKSIEQHEDIL